MLFVSSVGLSLGLMLLNIFNIISLSGFVIIAPIMAYFLYYFVLVVLST